MIGIIVTSLANIEKVAFPKRGEISEKEFCKQTHSKTKCLYKCVRPSSLKPTQVCTPKYGHMSSPVEAMLMLPKMENCVI